jgi:hypothetical protein
MHHASLNLTDLLIPLWRGTLECGKTDDVKNWDWAVLTGDVWKVHGQQVADAKPFLPGSFDRPPRNPALKISSRYKAWEFLMYVFGLGPALFRHILPYKYWKHFCKVVYALCLLHQRNITSDQVIHAHKLLVGFVMEYEEFYCQRREDRLHFCRPSIHSLLHLASEVIRLGPPGYYTQWTMERLIGNLGEEIKQAQNPYENMSQRGILRSQVNSLKAMMPDLEPLTTRKKLPAHSEIVGRGYVPHTAKDIRRQVKQAEIAPIQSYLQEFGETFHPDWIPVVVKWARLRLPNGQIARSAWKEKQSKHPVRTSRNVKVCNFLLL